MRKPEDIIAAYKTLHFALAAAEQPEVASRYDGRAVMAMRLGVDALRWVLELPDSRFDFYLAELRKNKRRAFRTLDHNA